MVTYPKLIYLGYAWHCESKGEIRQHCLGNYDKGGSPICRKKRNCAATSCL